jgi:hypothetical protein
MAFWGHTVGQHVCGTHHSLAEPCQGRGTAADKALLEYVDNWTRNVRGTVTQPLRSTVTRVHQQQGIYYTERKEDKCKNERKE